MQSEQLYRFIHERKLAVISTTSPSRNPQSALVGIAVSPQLHIVFDTVKSSRKYANLKADPRISLVVGWDAEVTVQYEGIATEPKGEALQQAQHIYFQTWPDGRERQQWPGITWFLITPLWIRYSDFDSHQIEEMTFPTTDPPR
jgi:pyridoxine/pyridoxamine 5'-phosphate oxidase